jgi:hypothetical protein
MFGHKWERAHGTIADVERDPQHHHKLLYVVDVAMEGGGGLRATVAPLRSMGPDLPPGTQVKVEVNAKTGEVRFDQNPVEGFSPGQIASPGGADWPGPATGDNINVTVNGAAAIGDVAEIVSRLGGGAAGSAVAAALANLGSGLTGDPARPGTTEVHVTTSNPEVRVVSGAEAAEMMRKLFGQTGPTGQPGPAPDQPPGEVSP